MAEKRILFADADTTAVEEFRRAFGQPWEVVTADRGPAALAEMRKQPCDVLVADLDLPELNGAELLNQVRQEFPKTLCFIIAPDADRERVMKNVLGAHQFLGKPYDTANLKSNIERALALDIWIASNSMRELVARVRTFPTVPSLYLEVLSALKSPNATTEQVGKIIAKDMAMMTKLLQVINSACFGLPRKISDPVEAVGIMGFEAVKSMVMTIKLLSQYDKIKPVYFSIDRLWRHSTDVARTAKQLTLMHTDDAAMAETAFTAGLIHDLGKVVLAANFDEQYRGAQSLARKQKLPLWEVEREIFGASHGEIGAYLLGLWGMPLDLMEVAALHHQPSRSVTKEFTPLTAVHLANVFEHELTPDPEEAAATAKVDETYLSELGLLSKVEAWRESVFKRDFSKATVKAKPEKSQTAKAKTTALIPAKLERTKLPPPPSQAPKAKPDSVPQPTYGWLMQRKGLVAAAVAVAVLVPTVVWLTNKPSSEQTATVFSSAQTAQAAPATPAPATQVAAAPAPAKASATGSVLAPTLIVRARTADTTAPTPAKAPAALQTLADLKLQGIFYSPKNSSAILNGAMVHADERFAGMEVVEITPTTVTVELHGQRRTLSLVAK
jgi:HD-like signal output (HDOD) protein